MKKFKKFGATFLISFYLLISFSFIVPQKSLATDVQFTPQVTIPESDFTQGKGTVIGGTSTNDKGETVIQSDLLARYIKAFYNWGLSIVGVIAVLTLMAAGVIWITSGGESEKIGKAKQMIGGSLLGAALLAGSWFILNTINPNLNKLPAIETTVITPKVDTPNVIDDEAGCKLICPPSSGKSCVKTSEYVYDNNKQKQYVNKWICVDPKITKMMCCQYEESYTYGRPCVSHQNDAITDSGICPTQYYSGHNQLIKKQFDGHLCNITKGDSKSDCYTSN